jgi:photosystem II stability/assembly factor-like uncharacterized protein/DNA-binding CsgD family transcriptional regulator
MQSLEDTAPEEVEKASYEHHIARQRETEITKHRQNLAKTLLQQLPESERTVVTLHYLGKMTAKEIGKFLGVSVNTIKSRLRRARKRLQDQEEALVRETLNGVQLPDHLIENVMRHIADLSPTPAPPVKKPVLPWAAVGAAVVLVILFGMGSQYLLRFQQPYSFDAQSEPTVELIDEPIRIEIVAKPAVRSQIGRTIIPGKNSGAGMQTSQTNLPTNAWEDDVVKFSASQWTQSIGPQGSIVHDLFKAADGTIYAAAKTGLYKLTPDATWMLINADIPAGQYRVPMAEHQGTLYTVSADEALASEDGGETWNALGPRPKGIANGLIVTAAIQKHDPKAPVTLYLALQEKGIFRSTDAGQHWTPLNNGLAGKRVYKVAAMGDTLFAGTNRGLYRLGSSDWQQLLTNESRAVYALTIDDSDLYVGIGPDVVFSASDKSFPRRSTPEALEKKIFHSADLGASWTEITPIDESQVVSLDSALQILAVRKTLLVLGVDEFRSSDGGKTWTSLRSNISSFMTPRFPAVAINERTFYKVDAFGVSRTTDAGASWHPFVKGMMGPLTHDLIAVNNRLYMHSGGGLVQSTDGGETWSRMHFDTQKHTPELNTDFYAHIKLTVAGNVLYVISVQEGKPSIFRTSAAGDELIPIRGVPAFKEDDPSMPYQLRIFRKKHSTISTFAVGDGTFYAKYRERLFKWKPGNPEWTDTGLVGLDLQSAVAASGKTVYASKPNGRLLHFYKGKPVYASKPNGKVFKLKSGDAETFYANKPNAQLFQSLDSGDSWKDITSTLPISIAYFKEIIFAGSTICLATDKGVLISQTGEHWRVISNETSMPTVIDRFAVDGTTICGINDNGAYRLDAHSKWELLVSEVPDEIESIVLNRNRLYVGTYDQGMFHISLEENN